LNLGISKKVIFSFFFFINFIQPGNSKNFLDLHTGEDNQLYLFNRSKISNKKNSLISSKLVEGSFEENIVKRSSNKNVVPFVAFSREKQDELLIESDKQSEINEFIYAEGNVSVTYRGKTLKADNLIYDKLNKKISANGNIVLIIGEQIFKVSKLEYNFNSKKGYLLDVEGSINTNNFMDDLSSNFSLLDSKKIESLLGLKKKEVLNTPGKVENWIFFTDKMTIDGNKWKTKKAVFSNDLLELKQVKLKINSLEVFPEAEKLRFKSSLNYLVFEEKVSVPFWLGDRAVNFNESQIENKWNFGYENLDKDGYFIGRKFNSIDIANDFVLDLEPQFLIQRSLKGHTKSFVEKGDSITSEKIKRNTSFEDYFGLKTQIKGPINNWDFVTDTSLNSFDFDKFSDAFRLKTKFSKEINFLNSKWDKSFYGIYRERIWNGSLGEAEIYSGYGSLLKKENTWFVNGIKKTEFLSLGLANLTAEALNTKNLVTNLKANLFYSFDQKFPISIEYPQNKSVDISYKYIAEPITKGLSLNTKLEVSYSLYESGDHQEYLGLGIGPEFVYGNFKNKFFDYTRISLLPFYKFDSGESVFKFDQNYEKFTLNISFDQQLFGPVILESIGTLNLTDGSDDYGEFINSKISLNWKKRSYKFGVFYQPQNQAGGISFELFGFQ
jgi:hypothetical protein